MSTYRYSTKLQGEHIARVSGRDLGISTKASVEICRWLRYRNLQKAKALLQMVVDKKLAVPYLRFNRDVGHKPGMTAGRYPFKAAKEIIALLESVEKNAAFKNLDTDNLKIVHMNAHRASEPAHYGRHGGRAMKRTHIEVLVSEEKPAKVEAKTKKKTVKKEIKKEEVKTEQPKTEEKVEEKKVEEPKVEETPKAEEPKQEVKEQPKAENIKTEEPKTEETKQ